MSTSEVKICPNCEKQFETTQQELNFLDKISPTFNGEKYQIPSSKLCYPCRSQRRLATRNETHLYNRTCDLTGKNIISIYSADKPFKVYDCEVWWGDDWEPMDYGQDYDLSRPFFEQFRELQLNVPRVSIIIAKNENSPYLNHCWNSKNSYMCFNMGFTEDALYSRVTYHCKNVTDTLFTHESELCYNLINSQKCYNCAYLLDCSGCTDSYFSFDCKGCHNIAFCSNLRNKSYHIHNKPVSKEEFEKFITTMKQGSYDQYQKYIDEFNDLIINKSIHRYTHNLNTENCTGDYILNSKNCRNCFDVADSQDSSDCTNLDEKVIDSNGVDHGAICELCYEGQCINGSKLFFTMFTYLDGVENMYCDSVMSSKYCFGCVGLKRKEYCILNKQYTKEEYEKLVPKIIEQMIKDQEYGEFFPPSCTTFAYNESCAMEDFPLTKEQAKKIGYEWKERDTRDLKDQTINLSDKITDAPDDLTNEILACEVCGKNYKLIEQEIKFYKKQGIPIPRKCFNCRHLDRMKYRTAKQIFDRTCAKCASPIQSSYSPDRPETVYCEKCYLKEVY